MKGIVDWYNVKRGFGFITGEDKNQYFIHYSQLKEGIKLFENTHVEFDGIQTDKGLQAQNVKKKWN